MLVCALDVPVSLALPPPTLAIEGAELYRSKIEVVKEVLLMGVVLFIVFPINMGSTIETDKNIDRPINKIFNGLAQFCHADQLIVVIETNGCNVRG
jgi:hypothetical protein